MSRPAASGTAPAGTAEALTWGLHGVTAGYGATAALSGITLPTPPGQITCIVGGDGAGKTTALLLLAGRVLPAAGQVNAPPPCDIGFQPATSGVWANLTVAQNIEFVAAAYRMARADAQARARELLERAGLAQATGRLGSQLSGGMRQKLGFCLAMLHRPHMLLLDEPSTGVDPVSRMELWRMISQAAANGTAVVMTTTYLDEAARAARVLALDDGHTLALGTAAQVLDAVPGDIGVAVAAPASQPAAHTWRRGRKYHTWYPTGQAPHRVAPDMEDALIALSLARAASVGRGAARASQHQAHSHSEHGREHAS